MNFPIIVKKFNSPLFPFFIHDYRDFRAPFTVGVECFRCGHRLWGGPFNVRAQELLLAHKYQCEHSYRFTGGRNSPVMGKTITYGGNLADRRPISLPLL